MPTTRNSFHCRRTCIRAPGRCPETFVAAGRENVAHATADIGTSNYATTLKARHHALTADEPVQAGGSDAGPSPHELLCAALAACTAITLRMYAQRKAWALQAVHVDVRLDYRGSSSRSMTRRLRFTGQLDDGQ